MRKETAVIYFTRTLRDELREKIFHQDRSKSNNLARYLIIRTRNLLKSCPYSFFEIDSEHQVGSSPIERLNAAFIQVFEEGYEKVLMIGNDCPELMVQDLIEADRALNDHAVILGRDNHNGAYLIGFRKNSFNSEDLLSASWGKDFIQSLHRRISDVHFLENELVQINHFNKEALANTLRKNLVRPLINLIIEKIEKITTPEIQVQTVCNLQNRRGPPFEF